MEQRVVHGQPKDYLPFPRYERHGECIRCGWCCDHEDCEHLVYAIDGTRLATCLIFESPDRPLKCGVHPPSPPIPNAGCGYWFVDKWTGIVVKAGDPVR